LSKDDSIGATKARFDRFNVDLSSGRLQRSGLNVPIQAQPFHVLRLLLLANGRVVSRDELRSALWPEDTFVDFEHSLNTAVRKLRQALEDSVENPKFIETFPRLGYRFIASVEWALAEATQSENQRLAPEELAKPTTETRPKLQVFKAGGGLVAILILAVAALWYFRLNHSGRSIPGELLHGSVVEDKHPSSTLPNERRLTANPDDSPVTSSVISPNGKYLAFTDSTGFYLQQIDSGETHPILLPAGFEVLADSWFPDSVHLVASHVEGHEKPPGLWQISILGGIPGKLTKEGSSAAVSPGGSQIAFLKSAITGEEIWLMQANGSGAKKLLSGEEDNFGQLAWSPDGKRIAYARTRTRYYTSRNGPDTRVEVLDPGTGQTTVVEQNGDRGLPRGGAAVGWLPDGRLVYPLREPRPNQQDTNLWWIQLNSKTGQRLASPRRLTSGRGIAVQLSLSSDGQRMALRRHAPQADVYVADIVQGGNNLSTPRRLTRDERLDFASSWTLDSRTVLFYSNRDGPYHIFKQSIDATQPERLVSGEDDLYLPRLSPDGASVLYVIRAKPGASSDKSRLMRVPVTGGLSEFVLEDSGIWDVECARIPSSFCLYSRIQAGHQSIFAFDPATGKRKDLPDAQVIGDNFDWCLSPDGQSVAWAKNRTPGKDFGVRIVSLASGQYRDIAIPGWTDIYGLDWSADSKSLWAAARNNKGIQALLHVRFDSRIRTVLSYQNEDLDWAVPSPDGRRIAIVKENNSSNVWLLGNEERSNQSGFVPEW
jgi:Tol biopolymer transport system component/DNA-binding winged helix-turn-helix (wHTH) protein